MSDTSSERRMIENELVFRNRNENLRENFAELKQVAEEDGQESFLDDIDSVLEFYCECSDENCRQRIQMKANRYEKVHTRRDRFVVLPGHEVTRIEKVITTEPSYFVVEKLKVPNKTDNKLQPTDVDNT